MDRDGSKWRKLVEVMANLWFDEHPNAHLIWVGDRPLLQYGDSAIAIRLDDMKEFLCDWDSGTAYLYEPEEPGVVPKEWVTRVPKEEFDED